MRTSSAAGLSRSTSSTSAPIPERWAAAEPRTRALLLAAAILAIALLWSFYSVVAAAVHRGEHGREQARLALDREAACSAFASPASRDLCLVTISNHAAQGAVVHAFYELPVGATRRIELRAGL